MAIYCGNQVCPCCPQGLSPQGHPLLTHPLLNFLTHVPGSANSFEHCGYVRAEFVCACDWVVLRMVGADGAWRSGLWVDGVDGVNMIIYEVEVI